MLRTAILAAALLMSVYAASADQATWPQLRALVTAAPTVGDGNTKPLPETGPLIVTFFASWCPPCTDEFRHLNELSASAEFGDAHILGINLFEAFGGKKNPQRMARFLKRTDPQFPLVEGSQQIGRAFGNVDRIPTVVVFGRSGREVWRFVHKRGAKKTHATKVELIEALRLARGG